MLKYDVKVNVDKYLRIKGGIEIASASKIKR
jgi:hypothetical protein